MSKNTRQPGAYDAVLGGIAPDLSSVAVLGGIDAVQFHLQSDSLSIKLAALNKALNYGEAGVELVIKALDDSLQQVKLRAYQLLKKKNQAKIFQAFRDRRFDYYNLSECLRNLENDSSAVISLAISPDSQSLVSSSWNQTIRLWDINSGQCLKILN